jgi:hypothetical protein
MSRLVGIRASLAAAALLVLAACGEGDDSPTVASDASTPTTVSAGPTTSPATAATVLGVTVRGGSVVEGASRQRARLGQPVTVRVTSDVADEVHVHGYDLTAEVAAGGTAELTFTADLPGVYEVELEGAHLPLFELTVT